MLMTQQHHISSTLAPSRRLLVGRPLDARRAAMALAEGDVVGQGFANLYVLTTRPDRGTVRRVNVMKGRPPEQVGSITTTPSRIPDVYDWSALPDGVTRRSILGVIDTFYGMGPFGFRGPAAPHVPPHLTLPDGGITTAQVISPGYACPSNEFLAARARGGRQRPAPYHLGETLADPTPTRPCIGTQRDCTTSSGTSATS